MSPIRASWSSVSSPVEVQVRPLQGAADRGRPETLARAVRAAEAVAPTRPHPGTDTALKNVAAGPVAAVVDRTRDVVRKAMR